MTQQWFCLAHRLGDCWRRWRNLQVPILPYVQKVKTMQNLGILHILVGTKEWNTHSKPFKHHGKLWKTWGFPQKCPSRSFRGWDQQWCTVARQAARTQAAGREPHFDQVHWSQVGYVFGGFLSHQNDRTAQQLGILRSFK